jgi:type I site-specific restriction endonuclease
MAATREAPRAPRWRDHIHSTRPFQLLIFSLLAAVVAPVIGAKYYTGEIMWPLVIGGYSGAALAFTTALFWDRHSRLQDEVRQNEAERRRGAERLTQEQNRRVVEAKRRFGALELELARLKASIERTKREQHNYKHFFPDLPTGSWTAASGPLGVIVSDYELMADLATFYGHVEELRWRLRFKADAAIDEDVINPIIATFVSQMADAVDVLLEQVREQIANPQVEQIVGAAQPRSTRVSRTRQFTGAIRAQTPEEIANALARQSLPGLEGGPAAPDGSS